LNNNNEREREKKSLNVKRGWRHTPSSAAAAAQPMALAPQSDRQEFLAVTTRIGHKKKFVEKNEM
jgi:hypothetical protein